jgi:DNA-binding NtrC family response regulator
MPIPRIALVIDNARLLDAWADLLRDRLEVHRCPDPLAARHSFDREPFEIVVLDLDMPGSEGLSLLKHLRRVQPAAEAIVVGSLSTVETVVATMRLGASDFLSKPLPSVDLLVSSIDQALARVRALAAEDEENVSETAVPVMHGESPAIRHVRTLIDRFALSNLPVLILGASGTGKELAAQALHARGPRTAMPFVAINCAGLAESLIDSELFGHEKGAFTGAQTSHKGLFDAADGGTLFLDEIGDIPPATQVRLLRTLQEGEVRPVGATRCHHVDVRVISATNVDLKRAIAEGRFREDLYFRLSSIQIALPALRDRGRDLCILAEELLTACARRARRRKPLISPAAMDAMLCYDWPGNVRELRSAIEYAVGLARGDVIEVADLPPSVGLEHRSHAITFTSDPDAPPPANYAQNRRQLLAEFDRWYFERLLRHTNGNLSEASRRSGVDRSNLRKITRELGLDPASFRTEPVRRSANSLG